MQDAVIVVDDQRRVIGLNHGAEVLLSVSESAALRKPLQAALSGRYPEVFAALDSGKSQRVDTDSGSVFHVQVSPIQSAQGSGGQVLIFRDVSDVEKAQSEVQNSEKLLQTIIDHSANGIVRFRWLQVEEGEQQLRAIFANAAAGRFLGVDANALVGLEAFRIIRLATAGMERPAAREIAEQFDAAVGVRNNLDVDVKQHAIGEGRWLRMICEPVGRDFAVTFVATTHRKEKELQMETIATLDALTGVLNRRGFESKATRRLAEAGDESFGALLFVDLNGFKQINDRNGHEAGDEMLRIAAKRLGKALRGDDIIGRPGGDEFVALVPDVDAAIAEHLAVRLSAALDQPYIVADQSLHCPASIGLALYPQNATTLTGLLREADQAMYRAKARTRGLGQTNANDLLEKAL
jgi:diguanylate cyclase (GGDEF)-like protein